MSLRVNNGFGKFTDVFATRRIDNLLLQPFVGHTLQQEINSVKSFVDLLRLNPINANTKVYIYATWGHRDGALGFTNFLDMWNNHQASLNGTFLFSRSSYDLLLSTLQADGYTVGLFRLDIPLQHYQMRFSAETELVL